MSIEISDVVTLPAYQPLEPLNISSRLHLITRVAKQAKGMKISGCARFVRYAALATLLWNCILSGSLYQSLVEQPIHPYLISPSIRPSNQS